MDALYSPEARDVSHKIGGLHQNDFIMAAKTDGIFV